MIYGEVHMDSKHSKIIQNEYFKYRINNCFQRLPKMKLSLMEERDEIGTFAYTSNIEMEDAISKKEPIVLHYHEDLFTYLPRYRNAILIHEFTHISDFLKFRDYKQLSTIMVTYSEFHATQMEFMKLCGINRMTTKCRKSLDTKICYQDKKVTIKEYIDDLYMQVVDILSEDVRELDDTMQAANASALIKHLMYFFGAASFYFDSQKEVVYNYFYFFDELGDYTNIFIKLYGNVVINQSFKYDMDGYVSLINDIYSKYLGIRF